MRIVYFYQYFGTSKGSWSTRVYEFARRWVKEGDSVTVVTSVYDKSDLRPKTIISRCVIDGIDVRVINVRLSNKHGIALRLVTFAAFALLSCWYALTLPADVVIASSGPITIGLPGLVARYVRRLPFIFEVRDLWPEGSVQLGIIRNRLVIWLARWFEKTCYRAATKVVALSEGQAEWIKERWQVDHLEVVPNASDNELVASVNGVLQLPAWTIGKQLVLYAGTLGLIDDCEQIVRMAQVMRKHDADDIEIVLIGDGKERAALEQKAREWQAPVRFLGLMSKEDVMRWLKVTRCSLFVTKDVPFLATASPNKLFDAFAAGVPVVQTTQGWIKKLLEREQCGITVPANDPEAMTAAVLRVVRDRELQAKLAANARRVARDLFDRSMLAEKMRGILATAAAHSR